MIKYVFIFGFAAFAGLIIEPLLLSAMPHDARLFITLIFAATGLFVGQLVEKRLRKKKNSFRSPK